MTVAPTAPANSQLSSLSGTSGSTSSASSATSSTNALNQLASNFNQFLTLLTTQLQNQDPLSPMDSTQFTQQLVAMTGVEAQINGNAKLDTLIAQGKSEQLTSAAGFIGDTITATGTQAWLDANNDPVQIGYSLPSAASAVLVQISDSSGNVVANLSGPVAQGANTVSWNGQNDQGSAMPSGVYNVQVQALDQNSQPITSGITQSIIGTVTNVTTDSSNDTELAIGSVTVPLTSVTAIQKPTGA